jgi:hypothetical protein
MVADYPANPHNENSNVSFPNNWNGGTIQGKTYAKVLASEMPAMSLSKVIIEKTPVFNGNDWIQVWDTQLRPNDEIKVMLADKRYDVEVGGVRVDNYIYDTNRESQTKYVAVAFDISQSNTETWSTTWKTKDGLFVTHTASEMLVIVNAVRNHVQSCFNKEAEYCNVVDTSDEETLENIDFSLGWPNNN